MKKVLPKRLTIVLISVNRLSLEANICLTIKSKCLMANEISGVQAPVTEEVVNPAAENANEANVYDYKKTCKITSRVSRVRCIKDGEDEDANIQFVVLQLENEIDNANGGQIVKTKDVLVNPWYLTNSLCDCSDLFAMLASTSSKLTEKQFSRLATSVVTLERTYHNAGDEYVNYEGETINYEEDGFMFELTKIKLSALSEKLLLNELA